MFDRGKIVNPCYFYGHCVRSYVLQSWESSEMVGNQLNPFASEAVYTRNFFPDRMSDSV